MRSIFPSKLDIPGMNDSFCKPFFNVESRYYYGMNMDYEKRVIIQKCFSRQWLEDLFIYFVG